MNAPLEGYLKTALEPPRHRHTLTFSIDADTEPFGPAGEYLVEMWEDGACSIAYREDFDQVWGPPMAGQDVS